MFSATRFAKNPILSPNKTQDWEADSVFNGCPLKEGETFHLVYRAISCDHLSTIGYGQSQDGVNFTNRRQLIKPEFDWEKYGCEDPRVTKLDDKYYIFYTALSNYPPNPQGIKIGLAVTSDFSKIEEKHQVTHFNSKAMALFPQKINGSYVAILSVNTDIPPAKIALAFFEDISQIWSKLYWDNWYATLPNHIIDLQRNPQDQIEVGAPPVKTDKGWLLIYCYIKNYFSSSRFFGIEAAILDLDNPKLLLGRSQNPLLVPQKHYELYGNVPNVIFPSGAIINDEKLIIFYGACDTVCCQASLNLGDLLADLSYNEPVNSLFKLSRVTQNPLLKPNPQHPWESKLTFNPAAVYLDRRIHIIYRAMDDNHISVLGYAQSQDGINIDKRLAKPIYVPRKEFEKKAGPGNSGCEDPRVTIIGDRLVMCYTAFDSIGPARVALTSIKINDFNKQRWDWKMPILISPPGVDDKNACLFGEKIIGKFVFLHRIEPCIWIDFVNDLEFDANLWLKGKILLEPRTNKWDSLKIGIGPPPIKTKFGWLLIYHGLSAQDNQYRLGAALLNGENPIQVIARLDSPILEPKTWYEMDGWRPGTVFSNGAVVIGDKLFIYYGAADQYVAVAWVNMPDLLSELKKAGK